MDDAASLGDTSSLNIIQTSSAILVESEVSGSEEYVTLEKAASGTEALRAGHPAVKQLGEKADKNRKPSGPPAQHFIGTPASSVQASPRGGPRGRQVRQGKAQVGAPKEDGGATSSSEEAEAGEPEGQQTPESDGDAPPPGLADSCGTYDYSPWINAVNGQQAPPPAHPPPAQSP